MSFFEQGKINRRFPRESPPRPPPQPLCYTLPGAPGAPGSNAGCLNTGCSDGCWW